MNYHLQVHELAAYRCMPRGGTPLQIIVPHQVNIDCQSEARTCGCYNAQFMNIPYSCLQKGHSRLSAVSGWRVEARKQTRRLFTLPGCVAPYHC